MYFNLGACFSRQEGEVTVRLLELHPINNEAGDKPKNNVFIQVGLRII